MIELRWFGTYFALMELPESVFRALIIAWKSGPIIVVAFDVVCQMTKRFGIPLVKYENQGDGALAVINLEIVTRDQYWNGRITVAHEFIISRYWGNSKKLLIILQTKWGKKKAEFEIITPSLSLRSDGYKLDDCAFHSRNWMRSGLGHVREKWWTTFAAWLNELEAVMTTIKTCQR